MKLIVKLMLLVVLLTVPVIILFANSNRQSTALLKRQIDEADRHRLELFVEQIGSEAEQFAGYSDVILTDPDFVGFAGGPPPKNRYAYAEALQRIERKLSLFSQSSRWMNRINVYFPQSGIAVSSGGTLPYDAAALGGRLDRTWHLRTAQINGIAKQVFVRHFVDPFAGYADLGSATTVVEVELMADNIVGLLDSFKSKGGSDPFLASEAGDILPNGSSPSGSAELALGAFKTAAGGGAWSEDRRRVTVSMDGEHYWVYAFRSDTLGMWLVDYVPLEDILRPVTEARRQFFITVGLLVLLGAGAAYLLYANVQVPIRLLTRGMEKLKSGRLSIRISAGTGPDFERVVSRFNDMAAEIQHLVEKVYREEIRAKEAVMKQLQSQINPHFLYNSLAYIISMVNMNRPGPAVEMGHELAEYFRYTTRNSELDTTLGEELAFVSTYLSIMKQQLGNMTFEIDVPETMRAGSIPRLLIQPLAENAVVHGLEGRLGPGSIVVSGRVEGPWHVVVVEDDGAGLSPEALSQLRCRLDGPPPAGASFGLWNVKWRLKYRFGEDADLIPAHGAAGGFSVTLRWRPAGADDDQRAMGRNDS